MLTASARAIESQTADTWVATLAEARSSASGPARTLTVADGFDHLLSHNPLSHCTAVFDGVLYEREELLGLLADAGRSSAFAASAATADKPKSEVALTTSERPKVRPSTGARGALSEAEGRKSQSRSHLTDADLVRLAYERWGEDLLEHVKGIFALIVWDAARNTLIAARDPLGAHPVFYAQAGTHLYFSTDAPAIVRMPGVSSALNRLVLAEFLAHRWPEPEDTYFEALRRVPPGHVVTFRAGERRVRRYWDPTPVGEPVKWVTEAEIEDFGPTLDRAVKRCLALGRTGIFLSGGFDSVSVAAIATDARRHANEPLPLALSLAFPDAESAEEEVQRAVAQRLGLPQVLLPFAEAVGPSGLFAATVEMSGTWPVPMLNFWNPAYYSLAVEGARRGCEVVLTGNGGDEWLGVTPYVIADLLKAGDFVSLFNYLAMMKRSYKASRFALWRNGLWTCGVRPLASAALGRVAPAAWRASRVRRMIASTPEWIAPDSDLRKRMDARAARVLPDPNPPQGFYMQDARSALDHPLMALDLEETFEMGRRAGLRIVHPYWDADLVHMLHRVPPQLLNRGGRSKGLVRHELARRFPNLGFDRQKKVTATTFFRTSIREGAPAVWRAMGRVRALDALGVADADKVASMVQGLLAGSDSTRSYRIWDVLSLEAWLRQHQN